MVLLTRTKKRRREKNKAGFLRRHSCLGARWREIPPVLPVHGTCCGKLSFLIEGRSSRPSYQGKLTLVYFVVFDTKRQHRAAMLHI